MATWQSPFSMVLFLGPAGLSLAALSFGSHLHLRLEAVGGSWLHLPRRLRAPCGALLRDGLDYLELLGLCFTAPSRFTGVDDGPLWPSGWWLASGPLRLAWPSSSLLDGFWRSCWPWLLIVGMDFVAISDLQGPQWQHGNVLSSMVLYLGPAGSSAAALNFGLHLQSFLEAWGGYWLHQLRRLRDPCGALLHDGLGCSELFGWCSLTPSRFVGADDGPLRLSRRWFALGPLRLLPGGGRLKPRTSAMLFYLGVEAWCFSFGGLGAWCSTCSLRCCFSYVGDLAGLLGQLVATLFGFGGAACSYFDDFDPFIVDIDGYS